MIIVRNNEENQPQITFIGEDYNTTIVLTNESVVHLSNELNRFVLLNYPSSERRKSEI